MADKNSSHSQSHRLARGLKMQASSKTVTRSAGALRVGSSVLGLAGLVGLTPAAAETASPTDATPDVVVTGQRPSLVILSNKLIDTPQTVDVIPQQVLHEQGVTTLEEALKNIPGITLNSGEGGAHGDTVNLRGFPANDDFFLDGMRDTGFYTRDAFDLESLEVYKGPASTLFGRGSTGGVINQVSKTPKLNPFDIVSATLGTNNEKRITADLNQPIGDDMAFRLNLMGIGTHVQDRDAVKNDRWGVAPSFAVGLGGKTTLTLNYLHQQEDDIPDFGIPFFNNRPAPVPRYFYYGIRSDDRVQSDVDIGTARLVHEFNNAVTFNENVRVGNYDYLTRQTAPHYGASVPPANTPLGQVLIYADRPNQGGVVKTAETDTDLTFKFATGPFTHTLIAGFEYDHEEADVNRFPNNLSSIPPATLLNPTFNVAGLNIHQFTFSQVSTTKTDTLAGFLSDTIKFGDHWSLIAGVRYDNFAATAMTDKFATATAPAVLTNLSHTDNIVDPRVALVYSPTETYSVYFSYGTSFDPSAENLTLSTSTANLDPEKDRTYELGAKALFLGGLLTTNAAIFNTEETNARVTDPVTNVPELEGDLRVNGFEIGATGYLTKHWEIIAGYTYLDARTLATSGTPANQVNQGLPNTAHNQANLWTVYDFEAGWNVGLGVNYLGKRDADNIGMNKIPGYVTFDGLASYQVTPLIKLQFNAYNLLDKYYYTNAYDSSPVENHVIPGAGRTLTLTAVFSY
jgi:catecholate siderophore receptor